VVLLCGATNAWATVDVPTRFCSDDGKKITIVFTDKGVTDMIDGKPIKEQLIAETDDDGNFFIVHKGRKYRDCTP